MIRDDISLNLIHFTKGGGDTAEARRAAAINGFGAIVDERRLLGGTGYIRGSCLGQEGNVMSRDVG